MFICNKESYSFKILLKSLNKKRFWGGQDATLRLLDPRLTEVTTFCLRLSCTNIQELLNNVGTEHRFLEYSTYMSTLFHGVDCLIALVAALTGSGPAYRSAPRLTGKNKNSTSSKI